MSVTLNQPSQKEAINRATDYWEPKYPYSNKYLDSPEPPNPVHVLPVAQEYVTRRGRMHNMSTGTDQRINKNGFRQSSNNQEEMKDEEENEDKEKNM